MPLDSTPLPDAGAAPARDHARDAIDPRGLALLAQELSAPETLAAAIEVWDSALCAQVDPEVFFPDLGQPTQVAKAVCAGCPVRVPCLAVFGDLIQHGVVGGLSVKERRARRVNALNDGAAA